MSTETSGTENGIDDDQRTRRACEEAMPDGSGRRLAANEIACQLVAIDGVQDFVPFCAVIEAIQDSILNEWSHEERCQQQVTQPAWVVAE